MKTTNHLGPISSTSKGGQETLGGDMLMEEDGSSLKYNLSMIPKEEFDKFHTMVRACFDVGKQQFSPELKTVSTHYSDMPQCHWQYLAKSDALGVAMADHNMNGKEFHLWISPSYTWPSFKFWMTIAHELTHGYAGLQYGHSAHWRRWFYRVMWHLAKEDFIPKSESDLSLVLFSVEKAYNYTGAKMLDSILEAFNRAEKDHKQVMEHYWERLNCQK